jgi:2,3-bisphosphoglycerate-independent phosphoglycerate mutase
MTEYSDEFSTPIAYPPEAITEVLARVLAEAGIEQLHVAETEKYPHVTYFFDGGNEHPEPGERWQLIESPRDVPTYDKKPSMSAVGVTDTLIGDLTDARRFVLVNFANPDMVGHTGVIPAAVEAVETVDRCLARVVDAVAARGGVLLITADHGNAERLLNPDGSPHTAHTTNPVPLIVTRDGLRIRDGGRLADIAPTVLAMLGERQPQVMTGQSLIL